MENQQKSVTKKHTFYCQENAMNLSGVTNVISYDDKQIIFSLAQGRVIIGGEKLSIEKLDTEQGLADVKGVLVSLKYTKAGEKQSIVKRLLK